MIYYFTGQPGAGKTTLAELLYAPGDIHIDGDDIREIFNNKDYSEKGRKLNVQRAHDIAQFMDSKGFDVIISLVSPFRELRDELKSKTEMVEIYVHTTEDRGKNHYHVKGYEPPFENFIDIDTTNEEVLKTRDKLMKQLWGIYK